MSADTYVCPHCQKASFLRDGDYFVCEHLLDFDDNEETGRMVKIVLKKCANPECNRFTLDVYLHVAEDEGDGTYWTEDLINVWHLLRENTGMPLPSYIPKAIENDYREAYAIKDLSPKASATLARRCLQGMIRNRWGITGKRNLYEEIQAIKEKVDIAVWKAIDAVRSVGNIGAHMEKDINLIVDVEPGEADKLIALIEMLIKDWYIATHEKKEMLRAIEQMAQKKEEAKKSVVEAPNAIPLPE